MDQIIGGLAVLVLIVVVFAYPQHMNCGLLLAAALGMSALLLRRCEGADGCVTFDELKNKVMNLVK